MKSAKFEAIANGVMPRDPKLPSDAQSLLAIAALTFCPVASAERRARIDHIRSLIESELKVNSVKK